jgi:hypothetical protein
METVVINYLCGIEAPAFLRKMFSGMGQVFNFLSRSILCCTDKAIKINNASSSRLT